MIPSRVIAKGRSSIYRGRSSAILFQEDKNSKRSLDGGQQLEDEGHGENKKDYTNAKGKIQDRQYQERSTVALVFFASHQAIVLKSRYKQDEKR